MNFFNILSLKLADDCGKYLTNYIFLKSCIYYLSHILNYKDMLYITKIYVDEVLEFIINVFLRCISLLSVMK